MTGALPSEDVRPPPWPSPDPIYTWPGPRLLGGEILELGDGGPIPVGAVTVPESAPAAEPQPPAPERAPQVPWWRRSARAAVAAGLAGALLARVTDGERVSSGPAGQ